MKNPHYYNPLSGRTNEMHSYEIRNKFSVFFAVVSFIIRASWFLFSFTRLLVLLLLHLFLVLVLRMRVFVCSAHENLNIYHHYAIGAVHSVCCTWCSFFFDIHFSIDYFMRAHNIRVSNIEFETATSLLLLFCFFLFLFLFTPFWSSLITLCFLYRPMSVTRDCMLANADHLITIDNWFQFATHPHTHTHSQIQNKRMQTPQCLQCQ